MNDQELAEKWLALRNQATVFFRTAMAEGYFFIVLGMVLGFLCCLVCFNSYNPFWGFLYYLVYCVLVSEVVALNKNKVDDREGRLAYYCAAMILIVLTGICCSIYIGVAGNVLRRCEKDAEGKILYYGGDARLGCVKQPVLDREIDEAKSNVFWGAPVAYLIATTISVAILMVFPTCEGYYLRMLRIHQLSNRIAQRMD